MFEQCREVFDRVFALYARAGCPCAFPRYRQLVEFDFRKYAAGPVGCHLAEMAIGMAMREGGVYRRKGEGLRCAVCRTVITYIDEEFSINMRFGRLEYGKVNARTLGAAAQPRAPMPKGFFGFQNDDIEKCAKGFMVEGTFQELERYLIALSDNRPRASATCPLA